MSRLSRCTIGSVSTRSQCAEQRCSHALRIREVLWRRGLGFKDVAARLGVTPQAVSATIVGKNHSAIVLDALREVGVPEEFLHDPRRVEIEVVGKEAV